jgi:hypothetical protein
MKLGRPRYLSDQLWHKVLITSSAELVYGQQMFNNMASTRKRQWPSMEGGPAAYEAVRSQVQHGYPIMNRTYNSYQRRLRNDLNDAALMHRKPDAPVATNGLKYWDKKENTWRVAETRDGSQNNMASIHVLYCGELGRMRFNTKLVRNLVWFVQLQRIMRVVLTNHLSWINTPVVRGFKIADSKVTEFNANEQYTEDDFNGNNYDII